MDKKKKFRNFCFTLHDYNDNDIFNINNLNNDNNNICNYIIYGKETCPNTGRKHLQGYIQCNQQYRYSEIKSKFLNDRIHIENAKGSWIQNYSYCTKDNEYTEIGIPKKQGKRNDIIAIKELFNRGWTMSQLMEYTDNYQNIRMIEKMIQYKKLDNKYYDREVIYIYGKSGSGKTTMAYNIINPDNFWRNNNDLKWFDGYDSNHDVIIDEFRDNFCEFSLLLQLLDNYMIRVPIKGGFTIWNPKKIIITSTKAPWELYASEDEDMFQLYRRLSKVTTLVNFECASEVAGNTIPQLLKDGLIGPFRNGQVNL